MYSSQCLYKHQNKGEYLFMQSERIEIQLFNQEVIKRAILQARLKFNLSY